MTCHAGILSVCVVAATVGCTRSTETPATPAATSPQTAFNFEKQVGIASRQGANVGCLAIFNDALQPGVKVVLADQPPNEQYDKPGVREAIIMERVSELCDQHLSASHDFEGKESYYKIRSSNAEWQGNGYQFAIVDPKSEIVGIVRDPNAMREAGYFAAQALVSADIGENEPDRPPLSRMKTLPESSGSVATLAQKPGHTPLR
jgi:hypothetical protein